MAKGAGKVGRQTATFFSVLAAVVAMVAILTGEAACLHAVGVSLNVTLPILAISSIVFLLGTLSVVSIAFAIFGLNDKTQALGLPDGSIRAVIALSLVVLFGILSIFMYQSMAEAREGSVFTLSAQDAQTFIANAPVGSIIKDVVQKNANHNVYVRTPADKDSVDFAKQVLTVLGTLVTAIASFYFGASAVASATENATSDPPPAPNGVTPGSAPAGTNLTLSISGSNLGTVDHVRLTCGESVIDATKVLSNASEVKATFDIPATADAASWSVSIAAAGVDYSVSTPLNITAALTSPTPKPETSSLTKELPPTNDDTAVAVPSPLSIQPASTTAGSTFTLSISGTNLATVDQAGLKLGEELIAATKVLSNAGLVTADFDIPSTVQAGSWTVVISASGKDYPASIPLNIQPDSEQLKV